jgi:hypothetical protein
MPGLSRVRFSSIVELRRASSTLPEASSRRECWGGRYRVLGVGVAVGTVRVWVGVDSRVGAGLRLRRRLRRGECWGRSLRCWGRWAWLVAEGGVGIGAGPPDFARGFVGPCPTSPEALSRGHAGGAVSGIGGRCCCWDCAGLGWSRILSWGGPWAVPKGMLGEEFELLRRRVLAAGRVSLADDEHPLPCPLAHVVASMRAPRPQGWGIARRRP